MLCTWPIRQSRVSLLLTTEAENIIATGCGDNQNQYYPAKLDLLVDVKEEERLFSGKPYFADAMEVKLLQDDDEGLELRTSVIVVIDCQDVIDSIRYETEAEHPISVDIVDKATGI